MPVNVPCRYMSSITKIMMIPFYDLQRYGYRTCDTTYRVASFFEYQFEVVRLYKIVLYYQYSFLSCLATYQFRYVRNPHSVTAW